MIEGVSSEGLDRTKDSFYHRPHLGQEKNNVGACEEPHASGEGGGGAGEEEEEGMGLMF